ncbi:Cell division protein DivIB [Trichinella pseudospiralis]|uniref:Uncharacterized protein n=1 Tax=Trichinella pseudospiralis TaxID=6337 RepID=A0A0V0YAV6_TRIPS|nr:hypothetical protein T4E_4603 [Trichinella pseudospiralis]
MSDAADVDWHAAGRTCGWLDFLRPLAIVDRRTLLPLENGKLLPHLCMKNAPEARLAFLGHKCFQSGAI